MFRQHFCFVITMWSWFVLNDVGSPLEVIVLAGDLEYSWQCMVFDVMPIACKSQLINVMC